MPSDSGDTRAIRVQATMSAYPPPKLADPLPCPRCNSTVTKFCYYNNYNLSQPRHFCKSCRRYWTHGGTLRNIPVGGGTRKNSSSSAPRRHRSSSSVSASSSSSSLTVTQEPEPVPTPVPNTDSVGLVPVQAGTGPIEPKTVGVSESNGSFASLLTGHGDGSFLALGGSGSGSGFGFEYSYGFGCGFDEIGLDIGGYHGSGAGMAGNGNGSESDTWNQMSGAQEDSSGGGESLVWPGLEISMPSKNVN